MYFSLVYFLSSHYVDLAYITINQTTRKEASPSFYVSICRSTYQMSQKYKIDMLFGVSN